MLIWMKSYTLQSLLVNWGQTILEHHNFKQKYELAKFQYNSLCSDTFLTTLKQWFREYNFMIVKHLYKLRKIKQVHFCGVLWHGS